MEREEREGPLIAVVLSWNGTRQGRKIVGGKESESRGGYFFST